MQGKEITRVTLVPNVETVLQYSCMEQHADIVNYGPGDIYVSWQQPATIGDVNCLKLIANQSYEIRSRSPWSQLSIIGVQAAEVQVVIR